MILHRDSYVVAQQFKRVQFFGIVEGISFPSAECDNTDQLAADFQRRDAFEQFRRHVAIRTQKGFIRTGSQDYGAACRDQGMNVLWEQRDHSWLWHQGEAFAGNRCEEGGLVAETEEHRFACAT